MRRSSIAVFCLLACSLARPLPGAPPSPLAPFEPDAHTLLLYHFDDGQGTLAKDASGHGYDGQVRGARWAAGKYGGALEFDGCDDCVFRELTEAIRDLKQITVECWFQQDNPEGRQFLAGKDVTFHFDLSGGASTSLSLYNRGAGTENAQGLRHQQVGTPLGAVRSGRWHHLAATYDGTNLSFFLDGVLKSRLAAPKDFSLGVRSRGLWVGCYVGTDFWFSGRIDEFRVSDCVRYDPQKKLLADGRVFELPGRSPTQKTVRKPQTSGKASLRLTLKPLYGGDASGWVCLKPPGAKAAIVGRYELKETQDRAPRPLEFDVSDELSGEGSYVVGLESTAAGYFAVTAASLEAGGKTLAQWSGEAKSRRTFEPPLLVPLRLGASKPLQKPSRILLLPEQVDRLSGEIEIDGGQADQPACLFGEGLAEYWLDVPAAATYRVYLRYAAPAPMPCDFVIDGRDLHDYHMAARNRTHGSHPHDALWEYQGTTTLEAGLHWVRVEGILPDLFGIRLEPAAAVSQPATAWERPPVPDGHFLGRAAAWQAQGLLGATKDVSMKLEAANGIPALRLSATFANTDPAELSAGDAARLAHAGLWDLEPFGQLAFRFEGHGSGHVISLWLVDSKGDEKLLWRGRDTKPGTHEVLVPVSFEGNDVFDPGHVRAVCIELDEAGVRADRENRFSGAIVGPVFHRRDEVQPPEGHAAALDKARQLMAARAATPEKPASLVSPGFRPWTRPVVPEEHPLFAAADPKPVTRKTLGYTLHTTGARDIRPETLDDFHRYYDFGDVCWPHIGICPLRSRCASDEAYRAALSELEKMLVGVRDRGLLLFDVWGYVPYHPDFPHTIAPEHHQILMRVFGDKFLGYDNGEQDGRYIGSYAGQGKHTNRKEGWDDFVRWDEHICADSQHYMNATGSLNFSHYYGERNCRLLGLETAQGLPSDTLLFAFLRGAGKQYGRLIYQASSIWNRFGYNIYSDRKTTARGGGYGYGPGKGCSRSLHRRLFFSGYLGGHSIFGTETSQFTADVLPSGAKELSPLGRQHLEMAAWARKHPDRGVMYTPVAFMLDFYNGWNMPRHLYRGDKYMIWGKFPYEKGDYLVDGLFRLTWPGYEDCSYLRNERGFLTPTPYGDIFDVVTNRCHPAVLNQYTAVMLLGDVEMTPEVTGNLAAFVRAGGDLLLDARNAKALPQELIGVKFAAAAKGLMTRVTATGRTFEELPYTYTQMTPAGATPLLTSQHGDPLMTVHLAGSGRVVVGAVDHWMTDAIRYRRPEIVNMEPPYRLLDGVRAVLDRYFDSFNPIEIQPGGLNVRTCCYEGDPKRLLVGLMNNDLFAAWQGTLRVRVGQVASVRDLTGDKPIAPGQAIALQVPAGDVIILDIRLDKR